MYRALLTILLFFFIIPLGGQPAEYGLYLQTWPRPSGEFTSISLENGKPIRIENNTTRLSFKIWNREEALFGSVFRIVADGSKTIDLTYSVADNDKRFPNLIIGNKVYPLSQSVRINEWIDVVLDIDPEKGSISITYDSESMTAPCKQVMPIHNIRIYFGACFLVGFELENVASVNIRDICISQGDRKIREWDFRLHQGDITYDLIHNSPAIALNGKWLIDSHTIFRRIYYGTFKDDISIAFNQEDALFYFTRSNGNIVTFDCVSGEERHINSRGGEFCATYPGNVIYIPEQDRLLSMNLDQCSFSFFDFSSGEWKGGKRVSKKHKEYYWNNSINWNPADSTLISFGGYGHYQFNNELLINYPFQPARLQKRTHLKEIEPRYSPATVLVDSILYIFGGRGNASGKQEMTQRYYYDLYSININSLQVFRLWEMNKNPFDGDFKPSSNMIYDRENDCFYLFNDQKGGTLIRLSRTEPKAETMSLPTSCPLDAQYLYTNLYLSSKTGKLYSLYCQTTSSRETQVFVHELDWPPILLRDTFSDKAASPGSSGKWKIIIAICFAAILAAGLLIAGRKRKAKAEESYPQEDKVNTIKEVIPENGGDIPHIYDLNRKSICFLGGFRAFDRDGKEITNLFTPTLQSLLVLLIVYTAKDEKGISGNRLIQTLWFDKTEESAKNNRNVYMSKLRNLLEKIGQIKIVNPKGFWSICIEDDSICDYFEATRLLNGKNWNEEELEKMLDLLLRGVMLPNKEEDWLDPFKNEFSNKTIDFLIGLLKQSDLSDKFLLRIANTLFQHDFINEEALRTKCRILYRQGKKGLAKTVYDTFCKDYYTSLGTEFPQSFKDIIN